jgi:hypothetical protein
MEVPNTEDLHGLPVYVEVGEEPGVVTITARADDGDVVSLAWDEVAASARIRWAADDVDRLVLEREAVSRIAVCQEGGWVDLRVRTRTDALKGELVVRVGDRVAITDVLLRG